MTISISPTSGLAGAAVMMYVCQGVRALKLCADGGEKEVGGRVDPSRGSLNPSPLGNRVQGKEREVQSRENRREGVSVGAT